ncbi:FAD-binding protein [Acuticoccus kandeliae]|uniref:FAD-binding protein n=1 Tax=Acuticoccus kandeliae TaxID=2073160 RepID=UPI000D3E57E7|nr:FAD-binding protein [Acuticoccus kandeliae]
MSDWERLAASPERVSTDILVLGGGIAGCRAAVAAREAGARVVHAYLARGASPYVIGANVPLGAVDPLDNAAIYAEDMIAGGYQLSDRRLVEALANASVASFEDLVRLGVPFARNGKGFAQRHLSGNTYPRSVFVPEGVGRAVIDTLTRRSQEVSVDTLPGWRVVSLIMADGAVAGALLADAKKGDFLAVEAKAVVLAMGGIGRLYDDSTYPVDIAADAYALALEAGADLIDMEFVQFEPLVTVYPEGARGMEMPTAMLGDGAPLLNAAGERFMFRYNPEHGEKRIEKARMSLCIQQEIDEGRGFPDDTVVIDTTVLPAATVESYVAHCKRLRAAGLDPLKTPPRVRPAAHSEMGGVFIDETGATGVPGLFACGEASGGIHGASRLAGNGGGETMAMGWLVGRSAAAAVKRDGARRTLSKKAGEAAAARLVAEGRGTHADAIKAELRTAMGEAAGLYRDEAGLTKGLATVERLRAASAELGTPDLAAALAARSARNMTLIAELIIRAALRREESRGAHQRRDHPGQDDTRWHQHIAFRLGEDGAVEERTLPIH